MKLISQLWIACLISLLVACAPASPSAPQDRGAGARPAAPQRTLVVLDRGEPPSFAAKPLQVASGTVQGVLPLFNATLDLVDEKAVPHPYLAEALPQLNTDSWRVFPDGRMETTYRLKPNLTYHDGTPLQAEDFAFAWRIYAAPEFGVAGSTPITHMEEVTAPDPRTVVIRWKRPYPEAGVLRDDFQALPRHILERPLQQLDSNAFANHPFWTAEYVGLGPYRLERWEPGSSLAAAAFDAHALGHPKIDRVHVRFMSDANTALANLLTGEAHFVGDFLLFYEEGATLQREWGARNAGAVIFNPTLPRITQIQLRPEFASPRELLDVRLRRALAHGIDTSTLVEVLTGGTGALSPTITSPFASYHPQLSAAIPRYPYDPRRAGQLLDELGLVRAPGGFYQRGSGGALTLEVWHIAGATNDRENALMVESLRQSGIEATGHVWPVAQLRDTEARAKLPALFTGGGPGGETHLGEYSIATIPRPENRWQGNNRGGWVNTEYDRLWQAFNATLDANERVQQIAEMERIFSEEVPALMHYYSPKVNAHVSALAGPTTRPTPESGPALAQIYRWEWR